MPLKEVNGTTLHYHAKGHGTPIVCIHPPLLTSEIFNYQMAGLSDEFRLITFDIRGHGHSAPSRQPLSYPLIVGDIVRLMDALGIESSYLCGYSTGATVALEALLSNPGRFAGAILLSGMPEMSDWYNRTRIKLATFAGNAGLHRLLSAAVSYGNADMPITYGNLKRAADRGHAPNIRQYYECSLNYACTRLLGRIRQPVLLVYGGRDKAFMRYAAMLDKGLPRAELQIIPGVGHQLPTKAPDRVHALIRQWLKARETRAGKASGAPHANLPPGAMVQQEQADQPNLPI